MTTPSASQLLVLLPARRRHHCEAVAVLAAQTAIIHAPQHVADLTLAAALHDVGYAGEWAHTGFHPLDGARALKQLGFSALVCHLVANHSGARREAALRGIPASEFDEFLSPNPPLTELLQSLLTWSDLNVGPSGKRVTVTERMEEILSRYSRDDAVHAYIAANREWFTEVGKHPLALLEWTGAQRQPIAATADSITLPSVDGVGLTAEVISLK